MAGRRAARKVLATVLFTDIVASTERASELGNRRWRQLLAHHHELVRRLLKRYGGREVDTAGDGFFAVFSDPGQGVACACTLVDAVKGLGIEIRAGLHTGECEVADRKVAGMAVHIGARILAAAGSSEVLVSGTVRDLLTGSDLRFDDRGPRPLKGVPGEWRLFAAALAGHPSQEELNELAESKTNRRRRWAIPASAVAAALVAGLVSLVVLKPGGAPAGPVRTSAAPPPVVDFVAELDPTTGKVVRRIHMGQHPVALAAAAGSIWVVDETGKTVSRIDPVTGNVAAIIQAGSDPVAIAGDDESIWVVDRRAGKLIHIDPGSNAVREMLPIEGRPNDVAVAAGSVWVAVDDLCHPGSPPGCIPIEAYRIDQTRNEAASRVPIPGSSQLFNPGTGLGGALNIVANGASVWLSEEKGILTQIDVATGKVARQVDLKRTIGDMALVGDSLWVAAFGTPGTAYLLQAQTGKSVGTVAAGGGAPPGSQFEHTSPIRIAAADEGIWITDGENGSLSRILEVDLQARPPVRVGDVPMGVCAAFGHVWVAVDGT